VRRNGSQLMPNKELGQHWLHSSYLGRVLEMSDLRPGDHVLEIGPGPGNLTEALLAAGATVTAVEFDRELYAKLAGLYAGLHSPDSSRLQLVQGDILQFDLSDLPKNYKVVANIPYYLTGKILRFVTGSANPPLEMTLLVQREVAERLAAGPGALSVIALAVQLFGRVELGEVVPASAFTPPPRVDSQVVRIVRHERPLFGEVEVESLMRVVKAGFGEKRKKLRSSLAGGLHLSKAQAESLLEKANVPVGARAQELSLADWYKLWRTWQAAS
jgi:16S rRNA (adenine1518-N6/adenine1519-N6)-dimethyltransferase